MIVLKKYFQELKKKKAVYLKCKTVQYTKKTIPNFQDTQTSSMITIITLTNKIMSNLAPKKISFQKHILS